MSRHKNTPAPPFHLNDRVLIIGPSKDSGKTGVIGEIYQFVGMYRFVVEFSDDGTTGVFFAFELVHLEGR